MIYNEFIIYMMVGRYHTLYIYITPNHQELMNVYESYIPICLKQNSGAN